MRYPEFRANGLRISTGGVEAGCENTVGSRFKRGGMRWSVEGANAIPALRCAIPSNRFDDFRERRASIKREFMIPEKEEEKGLTVWLYGEPIGILHRVERGRLYNLAFRYLTETVRPFSAAYPNPDENGEPARYTGAGLYQWFDNLLPESESLGEAFIRNAYEYGFDLYGLIKGNSAAEYIGAIGFTEQQSVQEYRVLEDESKRFRALAGNWDRPIDPLEGRRSIALAGAVSKTGVTIDAKGNWYYPANDSSHSTHVLKVNQTLAPAYDTISAYCLKDGNISQNQAIPIGHQYLRSRSVVSIRTGTATCSSWPAWLSPYVLVLKSRTII